MALIVCQVDANIFYVSIGMLVGILMSFPLAFGPIKGFLADSNIRLNIASLRGIAEIGGSILVGVSALTAFHLTCW
jgi:hypothetical protein